MEGDQTIDLREDEEGSLVETDSGGRSRTYFPHHEHLWLDCKSIQVEQSLRNRDHTSTEPPQFVTELIGRATLTHDELGLIGEPSVSTKTVSLRFRTDDRPFTPSRSSPAEYLSHVAPSGRATLSFNRAGWEAFLSDDWLLECVVSPAIFNEIVIGVADKQLRAMTIAVVAKGLWSDRPVLDLDGRSRVLLRPGASDNSLLTPESARGALMVLNMKLADANFGKERAAAPDLFPPKEEIPKPLPVATVTDPMIYMGARVESLIMTIKWVGGLIVAALLVHAFR